ncbi:Tim44-like domain-containing protein [Ruminococcus flavefaciens]|uniref:Tim44-like domain-containing protein n=1 Tax=Ruminococcus flavefaciens TaxID=1265 RepID=A0A1H6J8F9_RUMFL|nr:zinc-ribbon domain-containing transport protein [Ruminococcus flavefaciens]SEH55223.1 Tim44-like domain-containing protein [Ruminococcus flavefaciens]
MKKFLKSLAFALMLLCLVVIPLGTRADFGDFAGDSDYDSGWDSGGWDNDYDSGNSYDWDDDDDYHSSGGGGLNGFALAVGAIAVFTVMGMSSASKKNKNEHHTYTLKPENDLRSIYEYLDIDPDFSNPDFIEKVSNLYVRFQNEWQNKNIEPLRPYMTSAMFAQMDRQLDKYRQNNQTNHVERIAVLNTEILGWRQESGLDVIVIQLDTRIVDYVTDDNTGAIVRGDNTHEKFMTYEWTLVRTTGVTTSKSTGTTSQTCPYCGAHIDINQNTVCEYCGSVLTTDTFDWAVSSIKGISQHTKR